MCVDWFRLAPRGPNEGGDEASSEIHLCESLEQAVCLQSSSHKNAHKAQNKFRFAR